MSRSLNLPINTFAIWGHNCCTPLNRRVLSRHAEAIFLAREQAGILQEQFKIKGIPYRQVQIKRQSRSLQGTIIVNNASQTIIAKQPHEKTDIRPVVQHHNSPHPLPSSRRGYAFNSIRQLIKRNSWPIPRLLGASS